LGETAGRAGYTLGFATDFSGKYQIMIISMVAQPVMAVASLCPRLTVHLQRSPVYRFEPFQGRNFNPIIGAAGTTGRGAEGPEPKLQGR